jgi:hypothetical protein
MGRTSIGIDISSLFSLPPAGSAVATLKRGTIQIVMKTTKKTLFKRVQKFLRSFGNKQIKLSY